MQPPVIAAIITGILGLLGSTLTAYVTYRVGQSNRESLRITLKDDTEVWGKLPDGPEKDELLKSIIERTKALTESSKEEPIARSEKIIRVGLITTVLGAVLAFCFLRFVTPILQNYEILTRVYPERSSLSQWSRAFFGVFEDGRLTQRGARQAANGETIEGKVGSSESQLDLTLRVSAPSDVCAHTLKPTFDSATSDLMELHFDITGDATGYEKLLDSRNIYSAGYPADSAHPLSGFTVCAFDFGNHDGANPLQIAAATFLAVIPKEDIYIGMHVNRDAAEWLVR